MGRRRPRRSISQLDAILDVRVATVVRLSSTKPARAALSATRGSIALNTHTTQP